MTSETGWRLTGPASAARDGSHLDFPGMSKALVLRQHQKDALCRSARLPRRQTDAEKTCNGVPRATKSPSVNQRVSGLCIVPEKSPMPCGT